MKIATKTLYVTCEKGDFTATEREVGVSIFQCGREVCVEVTINREPRDSEYITLRELAERLVGRKPEEKAKKIQHAQTALAHPIIAAQIESEEDL